MTALSRGVRFVLYPSPAQAKVLRQWIGCQRVIYNAKVDEDQYFKSLYRKALSLTGVATPLDQQYAQFKSDLTPWLSEVPSQLLRNGAFRWMTAKQRQLKGLAKAPVKKRAHGRQAVLITKELFTFVPVDKLDPTKGHTLVLGTPKFPVGEMRFNAHRLYLIPNQLTISHQAGVWFLSFNFEVETDIVLRTPEELAYEFNNLSDEALQAVTAGVDRGVANRLADSTGNFYGCDPVVEARIKRKDVGIRRYQRRMARQVKGSANRNKTKAALARKQNYRQRCAQDWAHKQTYRMVTSGVKVHVLEALKTVNMVRCAKPKQEGGKWVRNGAAAKSGLNRAILGSCWGRVATYLPYKAAQRNQLVLFVPAQYSSQECSECKHTHPDNRPDQARFVCQRCGHAEHADTNAARVIKKRGIAALRAGIVKKPRKSVRIKSKTGVESPGVPVERPNKTPPEISQVAHIATKQELMGCSKP
jgi:putative transposase